MTRSLSSELKDLSDKGLLRTMRQVEPVSGTEAMVDGQRMTLFCSNDYLGLRDHPALIDAAVQAVRRYGTGAGASRLVSGNYPLYQELEERLACFKGMEACLVFGSGYAANTGLISALAKRGTAVFIDRLSHASIVDGCLLSRAAMRRFGHNDPAHLRRLLDERDRDGDAALVVSEGVFSMDGDIAPLPELYAATAEARACLILDDAHGTGVLGPGGQGTSAHWGLKGCLDIEVGTLSKALGGVGGFVAGRKDLIDYLVNHARSLIFSTAMPPSAAAVALAALDVIDGEPWRLQALRDNSALVRRGLDELGLPVLPGLTPIIPIVLGSPETALRFSAALAAAGVFVPAIRPPTVPPGSSRVRLTVSAAHRPGELDKLLEACAAAVREAEIS